jgi:hypothetical protein
VVGDHILGGWEPSKAVRRCGRTLHARPGSPSEETLFAARRSLRAADAARAATQVFMRQDQIFWRLHFFLPATLGARLRAARHRSHPLAAPPPRRLSRRAHALHPRCRAQTGSSSASRW